MLRFARFVPDSLSSTALRLVRTRRSFALVLLALFTALPACGFNDVVEVDENVKSAWGEVQNQYKRRADLVPQLIGTVKGAANFEKETLTQVTEARAKVGTMQVDQRTIDNPENLRKFDAAQGELSRALSRLMVVSERYPELQASAQFRSLQAQLEGTENRIAVARGRYIESVGTYNKLVQMFPTMIGAYMRGRHVRPSFEDNPAHENAPEVKF